MEDSIIINKVKYLIPNDVKISNRKHRNTKGWCNMFFYKNRKKEPVPKYCVKDDLVITSKLEYQKNIFYKMSALSKADDTFDFYYRLKDDAPKNIVKRNLRKKKKFKSVLRPFDPANYKWSADGKIICSFD